MAKKEKSLAVLLAEGVARLKTARGWTDAELARRVNTHQSNVWRVQLGTIPPSAAKIATYANAFGVTICELLCDCDEK